MSLCECDYDPCEVYRETSPRARRPHRCNDCGGTIEPGEHYTRIFTLHEGEPNAYKRCADCAYLIAEVGREWMSECGGWSCIYAGDLPESWDELVSGAILDGVCADAASAVRRLAGMQHACARARGGNRFWSIPLWAEEADDE